MKLVIHHANEDICAGIKHEEGALETNSMKRPPSSMVLPVI